MPLAQQLSYLWNDRPGPLVAGLVLVTSLGAGTGGYLAHGQTAQPAPLPVSRPVAAPAAVPAAVPAAAPVVDTSLVDVRTRERDAALERVEQLEALLDAAGAPLAELPTEAAGSPAPAGDPASPEAPAVQPAAAPDAGAEARACATAVGYFSDHDHDLAGVIKGDNDAERTGHSLGGDIVVMRTLSTQVAQPLGGLISAYAEVIAETRAHLLEHGEVPDAESDGFYETGRALQDHCAVVSDPLA